MEPSSENSPAPTNEEPEQPPAVETTPPDASQPPVESPVATPPAPESGPQIVSPDVTPPAEGAASAPTYTAGQDQSAAPAAKSQPDSAGAPPKKSARFGFWTKVAIICGIIIILAGAAAAAFFTLYLPRQPWYMLDMALKNTMSQTNFTANVTSNLNSGSSGGNLALKGTSTAAVNLSAKSIDTTLKLDVAGSTVPLEARLVSNNLYFEVGDLSGVAPLFNLAGPTYSGLLKTLAGSVSNHWFVVDSTLLDQSKSLKCLLGSNWVLSNSDSNYLVNAYLKKPFFKVESASSASVNGVPSEKLNVTMNDNEAAAYFSSLTNLQAYKSYQQCTGAKSSTINTDSLADNGTTPMTFWVDKSNNRIDQVALSTTAQDAKKLGFSGSFVASLNYNPVSVQAPKGAIPITQLLAQLEQELKTNPQLESQLAPVLGSL